MPLLRIFKHGRVDGQQLASQLTSKTERTAFDARATRTMSPAKFSRWCPRAFALLILGFWVSCVGLG
jgi:hypothetical protein